MNEPINHQTFEEIAVEIRNSWSAACEDVGANVFSPYGIEKFDEIIIGHLRTQRDRGRNLEKRLAILEAAVAFHGFDELPDFSSHYFIDVKTYEGIVQRRDIRSWPYFLKHLKKFTGWRYPVGDLSE